MITSFERKHSASPAELAAGPRPARPGSPPAFLFLAPLLQPKRRRPSFFMTMAHIKIITTIVLLVFVYNCSVGDHSKAAKHLARARLYVAQRKPKSAVLEYLNVIQLEPENDVAMFELAETYILLKAIDKAITYYSQAAEINPDNIIPNLRLGQVFLARGQLFEAREVVSRILTIKPNSIEAYHLLSGIHIKERNIDAALETLEKAAAIDPARVKTWLSLAKLLVSSRRFDEAEEVYLKAIAIDTSQRGPYLQLIRLYIAQNDWGKIESLLKKMILTPGARPQKYTDIARFYEGRKKYVQAEEYYLAAVSEAPEAVFPLMNLAEYYVRRDSPAKALEAMGKVLAQKPDDPLILTGLAEIYLQFEMIEEAEEITDRVLKGNNQHAGALYLKGRILMHKNDFAEAVKTFDRVIKIDRFNARAYYYRAQCIQRHGTRDLPEYNLQRAADGFSDDPESFERNQAKENLLAAVLIDPKLMDARIKLTEIYLEEKDPKRASEQIEKVLSVTPRNLKALTLYAGVKILEGDLKSGEELCRTVLYLVPDYVPGLIRLGVVYKSMGQNKKALESFEKAFELRPQETGILKLMADIYIDEKRFDDALDIINNLEKPGDPQTNALVENMKGEILLKTGQPDQAARHFRNAITAAPDFPAPYMRLAGILMQQNRTSEALSLYQKVEEINPAHQPALMAIGYIFDTRADLKSAETYYRKVLELNPEHALAANNLAFIIAEKGGDIEQAHKLALFAREKRPKDPNVLDTMGWVYYKKGVYLNAANELKDSLKLNPDNPLANYHLGMALYRLKEFESARTHLQKALALDPDFRGADTARSVLR